MTLIGVKCGRFISYEDIFYLGMGTIVLKFLAILALLLGGLFANGRSHFQLTPWQYRRLLSDETLYCFQYRLVKAHSWDYSQ